ncbi:hypothetical protein RCL_e20350_RclHR1_05110001 [Rhizophagus clarus]|uniref:Uncharacterized protein n=1 Tax=Rhizophagus clarus TaxID=94130 RepID=A0A8H3L861_9GLOM|nr:hypothetical protein RCL_e20350_RclHR1_05110001 [Rhizophagus clarus]
MCIHVKFHFNSFKKKNIFRIFASEISQTSPYKTLRTSQTYKLHELSNFTLQNFTNFTELLNGSPRKLLNFANFRTSPHKNFHELHDTLTSQHTARTSKPSLHKNLT